MGTSAFASRRNKLGALAFDKQRQGGVRSTLLSEELENLRAVLCRMLNPVASQASHTLDEVEQISEQPLYGLM